MIRMKTSHNIVPVEPCMEILVDTSGKKTEKIRILMYFLKTRELVLSYHRNKEAQLHSWNNNALEFWTTENFPGTNWSLFAKHNQQRQELLKSSVFSQNSHGEIRFFNITYRIFHKNQNVLKFEVTSSVLNKNSDNSFAWQLSPGSCRYPCFRLWNYTLWQDITALRQS